MKALVEYTYTYEVEVPDDTDKQDILKAGDKLHQQDIDENNLNQPTHVEVTYID